MKYIYQREDSMPSLKNSYDNTIVQNIDTSSLVQNNLHQHTCYQIIKGYLKIIQNFPKSDILNVVHLLILVLTLNALQSSIVMGVEIAKPIDAYNDPSNKNSIYSFHIYTL